MLPPPTVFHCVIFLKLFLLHRSAILVYHYSTQLKTLKIFFEEDHAVKKGRTKAPAVLEVLQTFETAHYKEKVKTEESCLPQ